MTFVSFPECWISGEETNAYWVIMTIQPTGDGNVPDR